jgi:uncharacterized membrane protein YtjA (UPF0391 family)
LADIGTNAARLVSARGGPRGKKKEIAVLYYAVVFFIVALIAALFGFGGIAAGAAGIAKVLFIIFLIVSIVTLLMSLARK